MTLFDPGPPLPTPEPLSATRRLTIRRQAMIAAGVHPLTRRPLLGAHTCGECAHAWSHSRNRTWWKCDLVEATGGPATDLIKRWPACTAFQPRP